MTLKYRRDEYENMMKALEAEEKELLGKYETQYRSVHKQQTEFTKSCKVITKLLEEGEKMKTELPQVKSVKKAIANQGKLQTDLARVQTLVSSKGDEVSQLSEQLDTLQQSLLDKKAQEDDIRKDIQTKREELLKITSTVSQYGSTDSSYQAVMDYNAHLIKITQEKQSHYESMDE